MEEQYVNRLELRAQKATPALLAAMEEKGLLRRIQPPATTLEVPRGGQVVEQIEIGKEEFGPWQMLAVACNRTRLDHLAAHADAESWLYFSTRPNSKPLLYVVATCSADEFQTKLRDGISSRMT